MILYSTINHLKYALLNGESGILRCVESKMRIVKAETTRAPGAGSNSEVTDLYVIDGESKLHALRIDPEEYLVKQALF